MTPAATESKPRGSRFTRFVKRTWKPLLVVIVVLVAIHGIATMILGRRFEADVRALKAKGQPVTMAELLPQPIPDHLNGAVVYAKAFALCENPPLSRIENDVSYQLRKVGLPRLSEQQKLAEWSKAIKAAKLYGEVVRLTQEAQSKPKCVFPAHLSRFGGISRPHHSQVRVLTKAIASLAMVDAHERRRDDAFKKLRMAFKVSSALDNEPSILSTIVRISCCDLVNRPIRSVLKYVQPNTTQVTQLNNLLSATDFQDEWARSFRCLTVEQLWWIDTVMRTGAPGFRQVYNFYFIDDEGSLLSGPSWKSNAKLYAASTIWRPYTYADGDYYLRAMDDYMAISTQPYWVMIHSEQGISKIENRLPSFALTAREAASTFVSGVKTAVRLRAETALTQILLAAKLYKARTGQYPDTMSQVRSVGLAGIPMDPFSGKEFAYQRTPKGFLAYSIGADLKDDGGRPVRSGKDYDKGGDTVLNWEQ
ncbi:MAG: hypothetical protein ACYC1M_09340 [Armatimonadota bacterium]